MNLKKMVDHAYAEDVSHSFINLYKDLTNTQKALIKDIFKSQRFNDYSKEFWIDMYENVPKEQLGKIVKTFNGPLSKRTVSGWKKKLEKEKEEQLSSGNDLKIPNIKVENEE